MSRPLKVIYKGNNNHFLVIGNHCRASELLDHSLKSGACVTWARSSQENTLCLKTTSNLSNLKIINIDSLLESSHSSISLFNMVLIDSHLSTHFDRIYHMSQLARVPIFVLDSWELSQIWLEDCAREFDSGLQLSHSECGLSRIHSSSNLESRSEEYHHIIPHSPSDEGFISWNSIETASRSASPSIRPKVYLIGAGPGDPKLLTVAARSLLESAKVVIADRLIPEPILNLVKGELKIANKFQGNAHFAQEEIYEWCLQALDDGHDVVRLKGGDPFIFGRGGEEVLRFRKHGYQSTVIPGISSSFSGPLLSNIPLTHRGTANQILITTGRNSDGSIPSIPSYEKNRTLVILMSVHRLATICQHLSDAGYPNTSPLAIIEKASMPDQKMTPLILQSAKQFDTSQIQQPALIVVGNVINALD